MNHHQEDVWAHPYHQPHSHHRSGCCCLASWRGRNHVDGVQQGHLCRGPLRQWQQLWDVGFACVRCDVLGCPCVCDGGLRNACVLTCAASAHVGPVYASGETPWHWFPGAAQVEQELRPERAPDPAIPRPVSMCGERDTHAGSERGVQHTAHVLHSSDLQLPSLAPPSSARGAPHAPHPSACPKAIDRGHLPLPPVLFPCPYHDGVAVWSVCESESVCECQSACETESECVCESACESACGCECECESGCGCVRACACACVGAWNAGENEFGRDSDPGSQEEEGAEESQEEGTAPQKKRGCFDSGVRCHAETIAEGPLCDRCAGETRCVRELAPGRHPRSHHSHHSTRGGGSSQHGVHGAVLCF